MWEMLVIGFYRPDDGEDHGDGFYGPGLFNGQGAMADRPDRPLGPHRAH